MSFAEGYFSGVAIGYHARSLLLQLLQAGVRVPGFTRVGRQFIPMVLLATMEEDG